MGMSSGAMFYFGFDVWCPSSGDHNLLFEPVDDGIDIENIFPEEDLKKAQEEFGIELSYHGNCNHFTCFICIEKSHQEAWEGCPREVKFFSDEEIESFKDNLRKACALLKIKCNEEDLTFKIASDWGQYFLCLVSEI